MALMAIDWLPGNRIAEEVVDKEGVGRASR